MTSKELALAVGCTERNIRKHTKKAVENGQNLISIGGIECLIDVVRDSRGKSYNYTTLATLTTPRKKRVSAIRVEDLAKIKHIDIRASKISVDDKFLIVALLRDINSSIEAIVKSLCLEYGHIVDKKESAALVKKISRWCEAFKKGGKKALEDSRGAKKGEFRKIDEELLRHAIIGAKAMSNREGFEKVHIVYANFFGKKHGVIYTRPSDVIAYSSIVSGVNTVLKKDAILRGFMTKGWDALLQSYPVGKRDVVYANQEWQVDATKCDFMVIKADGSVGRLNYTVVMDTSTGAYVGSLSETINSYDQTKVLYDAICKMGLPEVIRMDNGRDYKSNHYQEFAGFFWCWCNVCRCWSRASKG